MRDDDNEGGSGEAGERAQVGGCAAHGLVLLLASVAAVLLMLAVTVACWGLYRLLA
jgi:hypothetical protein